MRTFSYIVASKTVNDGGGKMWVYGYVRGVPLSADDLVHVTGVGSFEVEVVETAADPCPNSPGRRNVNQISPC